MSPLRYWPASTHLKRRLVCHSFTVNGADLMSSKCGHSKMNCHWWFITKYVDFLELSCTCSGFGASASSLKSNSPVCLVSPSGKCKAINANEPSLSLCSNKTLMKVRQRLNRAHKHTYYEYMVHPLIHTQDISPSRLSRESGGVGSGSVQSSTRWKYPVGMDVKTL